MFFSKMEHVLIICINSKVGKVLKGGFILMKILYEALYRSFLGEIAQLLCFKSKELVCIVLSLHPTASRRWKRNVMDTLSYSHFQLLNLSKMITKQFQGP